MRLLSSILLAMLLNNVAAVSSNQSSIDPDLVVPVPNGEGLRMNAFKLVDSNRPECSEANWPSVQCLKWVSIGYPRVIAFVLPSSPRFSRYFHVNQYGVSIDVQILDEEQRMEFAKAATRLHGEKVTSEQIKRAKISNLTCSLLLDSELITGTAKDLDTFPIRVEFRSTHLRHYVMETLEKHDLNNANQKLRLQCSVQTLDLLQATTTLQVNATELRKLERTESNVTYITRKQLHDLLTQLHDSYRNVGGEMNETRFNSLVLSSLQSAGILGQFEHVDFSTAFSSLSTYGLTLCESAGSPTHINCPTRVAITDLQSLFEVLIDELNQPRIRYVKKAGSLVSTRLKEESGMLLYLDVISIGRKTSIASLGSDMEDSLSTDLETLNDIVNSDVKWVTVNINNHENVSVVSLKCAKYVTSNLPTRISFANVRYKYPVSFSLEFTPILLYTSLDTPENLTSQLQSQLNRVDDRLRNLTSLFVSVDRKLTETKEVYDSETLRERFVEDASCPVDRHRYNFSMTCVAQCLQNPDCPGFYANARNAVPTCQLMNTTQNSTCTGNCCKLTKVASGEKWKREVIGGNQRLVTAMESLEGALRSVAASPLSEDSLVTNVPCARLSGSASCYYFSVLSADWNGAEQSCRQLGMHLVTIDSILEQAAIASYVKFTLPSLWWTGLQIAADGEGSWSSGRPFVYSNLRHNATTSESSERRCVALEKAHQYSWTLKACSLTGWYMCEAALSPNSLS